MTKDLDIELILNECGINNGASTESVIEKILALDEVYEKDNLVKIYNYFLSTLIYHI